MVNRNILCASCGEAIAMAGDSICEGCNERMLRLKLEPPSDTDSQKGNQVEGAPTEVHSVELCTNLNRGQASMHLTPFTRRPGLGHYDATRAEWISAYRHARRACRWGLPPNPQLSGVQWKAVLIVYNERDQVDPIMCSPFAELECRRIIDNLKY